MCLDRNLPVRAEDIDRVGDLLVDILDELLDGSTEYRTFLRGQRV